MTYRIEKYQPKFREEWDRFIPLSANGTFLHQRNYMDYHAHKFEDASYLIYKKNKLVAVLPAHKINNDIFSHQGLTYGEVLYHSKILLAEKVHIFKALLEYLNNQGFKYLNIKTIPTPFHNTPDETNNYFYDVLRSERLWTKPFFVVYSLTYQGINKNRRRSIKSVSDLDLNISNDLKYLPDFWRIIKQNLALRHQSKPVHSLSEIQLLMDQFPKQIKIFSVLNNDKVLAGVIVYLFKHTVHFQYIHANNEPIKRNAVDYLTNYLIEKYKNQYLYISFGSSAKNGFIDQGLAYWKESFGTKMVNQYAYKIDTGHNENLNQILQ